MEKVGYLRSSSQRRSFYMKGRKSTISYLHCPHCLLYRVLVVFAKPIAIVRSLSRQRRRSVSIWQAVIHDSYGLCLFAPEQTGSHRRLLLQIMVNHASYKSNVFCHSALLRSSMRQSFYYLEGGSASQSSRSRTSHSRIVAFYVRCIITKVRRPSEAVVKDARGASDMAS